MQLNADQCRKSQGGSLWADRDLIRSLETQAGSDENLSASARRTFNNNYDLERSEFTGKVSSDYRNNHEIVLLISRTVRRFYQDTGIPAMKDKTSMVWKE